jgi:hypothetical protein
MKSQQARRPTSGGAPQCSERAARSPASIPPHHYPRPRHERRRTLGDLRRDGRLDAAPGPRPAALQPHRPRHEPQQAVHHPRYRHEDDTLLVEGRVPEDEVEKLRKMGHRVELGTDYVALAGGAQLIRILENGVRACGIGPRKEVVRWRSRVFSGRLLAIKKNTAPGIAPRLLRDRSQCPTR